MCGILGIVGKTDVVDRLLVGLKRLEYRGYDSSGIAVHHDNTFVRRRKAGKIQQLEALIKEAPIFGMAGIAHTRWATHGAPTDTNAHPHMSEKVSIVHNGIIENHAELRQKLQTKGYQFTSQTDTEVVAFLLTDYLNQGAEPLMAVQQTLSQLKGAYSFAILFKDYPDVMIGARQGSPLAIGYGEGEMYLGSDAIALSHLSRQISYLEEGDIAYLTSSSVQFYNTTGQPVERPVVENTVTDDAVSKVPYPHYMLKEICEQPDVIRQTLSAYLNSDKTGIMMPDMAVDWTTVGRLTIVACGTAYYAGLVAKYWFEYIARLPVEIDVASEFRYRQPPFPTNSVSLFVSQSGETADTLAAFNYAKSQGQYCLGVVNVPKSSLARDADTALLTYAGVEIGVASTKAFTTQLTVLAILALHVAHQRGKISAEELQGYCQSLAVMPSKMGEILQSHAVCQQLATRIAPAKDVLYLGRGTSFAIAMEGALKLKEISYIHAEGYAAGEMKHGPIALIDEHVPIIVIAPKDRLFEKTASNIEECIARQGRVIVLTDQAGAAELRASKYLAEMIEIMIIPDSDTFTAPILYAVPIQLLAYDIALLKGTDVDQPRNLAKSVTVE